MPLRLSLAALALLALVPVAFWPAYLSKLNTAHAATHAHAVLGTCWLVLLLVQPLLIRASRRGLHRWLGRIGVVVGLAFLVSGVLVAQRAVARMSAEQFAREGHLVYLPLAMAAIFGIALWLAVSWRHSTPLLARFMAATALALLDPLFSRLLFFYAPPLPADWRYPLPAFALALIVLAALPATLPAAARGRRTLQGFCLGVAALLLGFFYVPQTAAWLAFAAWFRALASP